MSTTEENECCYRKYCVLFKQGVLHESLKEIFFPFINKKYDNYTNKESRKKLIIKIRLRETFMFPNYLYIIVDFCKNSTNLEQFLMI